MEGNMKIKIKETANINSLKNKYISIRKGQIITIPSYVEIDESVFDILEKNGQIFIKEDKLTNVDIERLLQSAKPSTIIEELKKRDISYNDVSRLLQYEVKKFKRKELLEYLMSIPQSEDKGVLLTDVSIWINELMSIKEISHEMARNIITVYPTKEVLLSALKEEENIPFESVIEDALRRTYDHQIEKEIKSKTELKKDRVEMEKMSNTGTTTREHFKFIKRNK